MQWNVGQRRLMLVMLIISPMLYAMDLGIVGQIYPIQEDDFLQVIIQRLKTMQQNGEWGKLQNQFRYDVEQHAVRPHSVANITKTIEPKSWHYDPSITVPYDLKDHTGRLFAKAGTIVNPLKFVTIHKAMLFFDGDDAKQVVWAHKLNKRLAGMTKLILVNGSILDQEKIFHQPIYFDQAGRLTTRFHIRHVPAVVVQDGIQLKIAEVLP